MGLQRFDKCPHCGADYEDQFARYGAYPCVEWAPGCAIFTCPACKKCYANPNIMDAFVQNQLMDGIEKGMKQ